MVSLGKFSFDSFAVSDDDGDDGVSQEHFNMAVALSTILCFIGGLAIGMLIYYFAFAPKGEDTAALNKV